MNTSITYVKIKFNENDLPYEEEILRNPFSVKHWLRYIEHKKNDPQVELNALFERAIKELPGSYKLWYKYLRSLRRQVKSKPITDHCYEDVNNTYERSLVFMHKMPRIWIDYCQFLSDQCLLTRSRKAYDRALRALPVTQHNRIWPNYLEFVRKFGIIDVALRVYRRYMKLSPENAEEFVDFLVECEHYDEAARLLVKIVNDEKFVSIKGKSKYQLWSELCEIICTHPTDIHSLNVDAVIRGGLRRYTDQLGQLWVSLANYYVRSGLFERARDIYEEAIQTVKTVRDFTQVFDAYAQFQELRLSRQMSQTADKTDAALEVEEVELELGLARYEHLIERRPLLLNSVLLRQNPHNVKEWQKRVTLYEGRANDIINTYTEAVQTVDPKLAVGQLHSLWIDFAKYYENNGQVEDARLIFENATRVPYVKTDDLATVWCEWAEMEVRNGNSDESLRLLSKATLQSRKRNYGDDDDKEAEKNPQQTLKLYKSLKVWSMLADLEESFGTFKSCKAVYDRMIELRIATPQIIINFGLFLEENKYFDDAFQAYEKGVSLFKWPNVHDIWNVYLVKFLKRYGRTKVERVRDLFEQCLEHCPAKFAKKFYLMFASFEEEHGMARHAMEVYERATKAVPLEEMHEVFNVYIKKVSELFGVPKTRAIYEKAIEMLPESQSRDMCLRFASVETRLGEIDRARAIYIHCSQMSDPRTTETFWHTWKEFEIRHGNESTMREMLRIKRSVQAMFNTQVNMISAQILNTATTQAAGGVAHAMKGLESEVDRKSAAASNIAFVRGAADGSDVVTNPEEFNLDDIDVPVQQQIVPDTVFGSITKHI